MADGDTTYYAITNDTDWEVGIGTYSTTGPTLARTTVLASSNGGSAVNWGAGVKNIFISYAASKSVYLDANGDLLVSDKIIHDGDTNTAIRFPAADTVSVETGGTERFKVENSTITTTVPIVLPGDPTSALHAATKQYVDEVAEGLRAKPAAKAATTANLSATYNNGTSGVGATLTSTTNGAFPTLDGVSSWAVTSPPMGVLVKNQSNAAQNGRYNLTTLGDGSAPWVLTRCGLCDTSSEIPGSYIFVTDGTLYADTGWVMSVSDPSTFTIGTDPINVIQFSGAGTYTAGSGLALNGTEFSNTAPDQTVTLTQGGATTISGTYPNFTITSTDTTYSAGNGIGLAGTTFSVAAGSGLTQDASGLSHADTSSQSSVDNSGATFVQDVTLDTFGHVTGLTSVTATPSLIGAPSTTGVGASGSWGISVTGTALNVTGTVAIANGGTGATTAGQALNNLGLTATATELNYTSGVTSAIQTQLNAKAPLASPALSGTPTAPTASVGTDTTQIATTAFVNAEIANDAPTKTGGGASGTWNIAISGNAATATSATTSTSTTNPTFSGDAVNKADITTRTESGFYEHDTGTTAEGWPRNDGTWQHMIASTHSNDSNYYSMQLAGGFYSQQWYMRNTNGNGSTSWSELLTSASYNSYAPSLTGTGASGNWAINVTGNAATTSQRNFSGDIAATGQGRFTGWYGGGSGNDALAAEVGVSGGTAYVLSYNRGTSTYGSLTLNATNISLDPQGGSISLGANIGVPGDSHMTFGPNSTWGSSLRVGGNGRTATGTEMASVVTTDGNLHLDPAASANATYLNYYAGTNGVTFGNGASSIVAVMGPDGDLWKGGADNTGTQYVQNTGTWGISITGDAGSVDGLSPPQFYNNMGQNHNTQTDFNAVSDFGARYLQGGTNGPTVDTSDQFYGFTMGLGNDYPLSQYGSQFYWPRAAQDANTYIYVRDREGGSWGSWRKTQAGYADSAGSVAWGNVSSKPSNIMYYQGFTLDANTMDSNSTGFTYSVNAPATGPVTRISAGGGYDLWLNAPYSGGGTNLYFRTRNGDTATLNDWRTVLNDANYTSYAPSLTGSGASGTWGINVTGYSTSVNLGNSSAKQLVDNVWAGGVGYPGYSFTGGNSRFGFSSTGGVIDVYADGNFYATDSSHLVLHAGNYGSYALPLTGGTVNGQSYFTSSQNTGASAGNASLQAYSTGGNGAVMSFHRGGHYAVNMGLDSDNVFRIGGWSAPANLLQMDMSGNLTMANNVTAYSDIRLKEDLEPITDAIEKVQSLTGYTYTRIDSGQRQTGLIAQEVQKVLPEAVMDNGEHLSLAYGNMVGLLIEAIKEQQVQINELKSRLKD
jgi:hypothetical protein